MAGRRRSELALVRGQHAASAHLRSELEAQAMASVGAQAPGSAADPSAAAALGDGEAAARAAAAEQAATARERGSAAEVRAWLARRGPPPPCARYHHPSPNAFSDRWRGTPSSLVDARVVGGPRRRRARTSRRPRRRRRLGGVPRRWTQPAARLRPPLTRQGDGERGRGGSAKAGEGDGGGARVEVVAPAWLRGDLQQLTARLCAAKVSTGAGEDNGIDHDHN
jgi:hypothetical protein